MPQMGKFSLCFLALMFQALPEKAQIIGRIVYDGVSQDLWDRISHDLPDIIPRHVDGHIRSY
jgi:hypothetical protein